MDMNRFESQYGPESATYKRGHDTTTWEAAQPLIARLTVDEPVDSVAFTDDLTKDEMIEHLVNVHKIDAVQGKMVALHGTKATKSEMIAS